MGEKPESLEEAINVIIDMELFIDSVTIKHEKAIADLTAERDAALAEIARLRKLEAWAKDFVANAPITHPCNVEGYDPADPHIAIGWRIAHYEIARALLESEASE